MKSLLDPHFLPWLLLDVPRIDEFPRLENYRPWGVSPVTFLEIQFLAEMGRLEVARPEFLDAVGRDPRFTVDRALLREHRMFVPALSRR